MVEQLTARHLRKEYRLRGGETLVAVHDVSFSVSAGDSLAIVGESGSGKTTCARIVAGLEPATSGTVLFDEQEVDAAQARVSARRWRARQVQMVFQDPYSSLDPRQSVNDSVSEVLAAHGLHDRRERAARTADLLDKVGLPERVGRSKPKQLSGGQRQRVAIMKALAVKPRLLILDEAVSALDVSVQAQVINLLSDLRASEKLAFLFISHDLGVVRQVSDRVMVMRHGRVVEEGSTDAVLDAPSDPYTQRLLDAIPRPGWKPVARAV
ncbi:ATP-binding cassette domain-containing protein [Nocardioides sp. GY 10127]|uniref:ABC transporter ATP-binding protein n=1 Tax=Nocardioides sp. GY 10127 TaxID=2569762 RepID=UPI0010A8F630|nr:ATP-binding cassette domain-containing protein [Nocardioides sp. GY 10127]TIC79119.1 ABC transporter ATP-binding protein [Nocardioides sp. GY 10127]